MLLELSCNIFLLCSLVLNTSVQWDAGFAGYIHNCSASVAYYSKGHPLRSDDIPFPRPNRWWEEAAVMVTMQLVFGYDVPNASDPTLHRTCIKLILIHSPCHAVENKHKAIIKVSGQSAVADVIQAGTMTFPLMLPKRTESPTSSMLPAVDQHAWRCMHRRLPPCRPKVLDGTNVKHLGAQQHCNPCLQVGMGPAATFLGMHDWEPGLWQQIGVSFCGSRGDGRILASREGEALHSCRSPSVFVCHTARKYYPFNCSRV